MGSTCTNEGAPRVRDHLMARGGRFPNRTELLPIGALAPTIALAAVTYHGYERRFLRLERAWTRVPSRPV